MGQRLFYQTLLLTRFSLKKEWLKISLWFIGIIGITLTVTGAFSTIYQTAQEKMAIAEMMKNPAMIAMVGTGYGLNDYTIGAMMGQQMLLFTAIIVAVMNILLVARMTRGDEEDGILEMIRSLPVGRLSNLAATIMIVFFANLLLSLLVSFGLIMLNISGITLGGSLLYGAVLGGTGLLFAAVTALFAQLCKTARGTMSFSFAVLGIAYLIRAFGDMSNQAISWFSPLGWGNKTEVYVSNYWFPVWLTIGASVVIGLLAFYLNALRDMNASYFPEKVGKGTASSLLASPFGLVVRLQKSAIIVWLLTVFILGAAYGSVFGDLESFFANNAVIQAMFTTTGQSGLTEQFLDMIAAILAIMTTVPVILSLLKLKSEEKKNRLDNLLTKAVSRSKLLGSYFILACITMVALQTFAMLGIWVSSQAVMATPIPFGTVLQAGLVYLPAIFLMLGVATFLIGFFPQFSGFVWLYLLYSFVTIYLGNLLKFPAWMMNLSPFGLMPKIPAESIDVGNFVFVIGIGIGLGVLGFVGYRRRDIVGG